MKKMRGALQLGQNVLESLQTFLLKKRKGNKVDIQRDRTIILLQGYTNSPLSSSAHSLATPAKPYTVAKTFGIKTESSWVQEVRGRYNANNQGKTISVGKNTRGMLLSLGMLRGQDRGGNVNLVKLKPIKVLKSVMDSGT
ncbi:hypothetical protein Tco_0898461 [Tanacetum coccineum]